MEFGRESIRHEQTSVFWRTRGTINVRKCEVGNSRSRKPHAVTEWHQRVENIWENSSHWQENRSMTGNSTGGEKHKEGLKLHHWQIVMDLGTIQGFSLVFVTNYVVLKKKSWKIEYGFLPNMN